ncbi:MAG: hypothetical protein E7321_02635 [Clostridiales bacterium]|nr:hypothetical protein [Clostridiales bacterium]
MNAKNNVFVAPLLALVMIMSSAMAAVYTFDPATPHTGVMTGSSTTCCAGDKRIFDFKNTFQQDLPSPMGKVAVRRTDG